MTPSFFCLLEFKGFGWLMPVGAEKTEAGGQAGGQAI